MYAAALALPARCNQCQPASSFAFQKIRMQVLALQGVPCHTCARSNNLHHSLAKSMPAAGECHGDLWVCSASARDWLHGCDLWPLQQAKLAFWGLCTQPCLPTVGTSSIYHSELEKLDLQPLQLGSWLLDFSCKPSLKPS